MVEELRLEGWRYMSRGERLRLLRKLRNLTQSELGGVVSKSRQTIIAWENDRAEPDLDSAHIIASELGAPIELITSPQEDYSS